MAKIIKVAPTTSTHQVANPFRTSRNSTTNPFKYSNFEGNTLQFADVFEGFEPSFKSAKGINKLKMVASSVTGSMNKIKTGITEPIVNFVKRVSGGISGAWEYAKNTNISDIGAVKAFNRFMQTEIEIPGLSYITNGISSRITSLNNNVTNIGKDISSKWSALISKFQTKSKISSQMSVSELEQMWKDEISLAEAV